MRISKWLAVAVMCSALAGCNCGGGGGNDGGGGGMGGAGGSGGGTGGSGGGTGGAGGGSTTPGLELADFCSNASTGFKEQLYREVAVCGIAITRADVPHIFYYYPYATFPDAYAGSLCSDGGLADQMGKYQAAVTAGRLRYDREKALECQTTGRGTRDDGGYPFSPEGMLKNPCAQIWVGLVNQGGNCEASYECAGNTYCKPSSATSCGGTCQPKVATDAPCSPVRDVCNDDAYCDQNDGGTYACLPKLSLGEVCDSQGGPECKPGLYCLGTSTTETCLPIAKLGEVCRRFGGSSTCAEGTCLVDAGTTPGAQGLCVPAAGPGQACGNSTNGIPRCDGCTFCDAGTCQTWGLAGATCVDDTDCFDEQFYYCNQGTLRCTVKPRAGEGCLVDDDGAPGNCMYFDNWCKKSAPGDAGVVGACTALPGPSQPCGNRYDLYPECPTDYYCVGPQDAGVGTCGLLASRDQRCSEDSAPPFGVSPGCLDSADFCDTRADAGGDGLYDGICRARGTNNDYCDSDVLCQAGLICDPPASQVTDGGLRRCIAKKPVSSPCTSSTQCQSGRCQADAGVCVALTANGLPCNSDGECQSDLCDPASKVCVEACAPVASNEQGGCMNYDLASMSGYIFFSIVLVPLFRLRRRGQKKS